MLGDPFEGSLPRMNDQDHIRIFGGEEIRDLRAIHKKREDMPKCAIVNCWQISDAESTLMWNKYSSNYGVAIQSTFRLLKEQFVEIFGESEKRDVYVGLIKYMDYEPPNCYFFSNVISPLMCKRLQFRDEKEVRAIVAEAPPCRDIVAFDIDVALFPDGENISVNLEKLVENIIIYPGAPEWYKGLVKSVTEKYELDVRIISSSLELKPYFG
jgi:hypothetical protein